MSHESQRRTIMTQPILGKPNADAVEWLPAERFGAHPWLAELGDSPLGETLSDLSGVERGAYEYAWLPAEDAVTARALRDAEVKPAGLWARRSRVALRGAPLLMQELFLPAMGRV
jgi:chorismate-pyruvate lyase